MIGKQKILKGVLLRYLLCFLMIGDKIQNTLISFSKRQSRIIIL